MLSVKTRTSSQNARLRDISKTSAFNIVSTNLFTPSNPRFISLLRLLLVIFCCLLLDLSANFTLPDHLPPLFSPFHVVFTHLSHHKVYLTNYWKFFRQGKRQITHKIQPFCCHYTGNVARWRYGQSVKRLFTQLNLCWLTPPVKNQTILFELARLCWRQIMSIKPNYKNHQTWPFLKFTNLLNT